MLDDPISRIEAALDAGPTPGPWRHEAWGSRILDSGVGSSQLLIATVAVNTSRDQGRHNAEFIAACDPAAIRALLDRLMVAEAENERLRQLEQSVSIALPDVYYMNPPDGGDVQMDEQLRRMAKDAERYRHLRRKVAIVGAEFRVMNLPSPTFVAPIAAIEFDSAIDKEISARTDARPPTPIGWSDTDFIKHLEDQARHPLEGLHINRGSVDAAADAYEAEYNAARGIT